MFFKARGYGLIGGSIAVVIIAAPAQLGGCGSRHSR
jgi:hypothetical protein